MRVNEKLIPFLLKRKFDHDTTLTNNSPPRGKNESPPQSN
jgi:hypothetical protein